MNAAAPTDRPPYLVKKAVVFKLILRRSIQIFLLIQLLQLVDAVLLIRDNAGVPQIDSKSVFAHKTSGMHRRPVACLASGRPFPGQKLFIMNAAIIFRNKKPDIPLLLSGNLHLRRYDHSHHNQSNK